MRAYVDADVLIWHLRGAEKATEFLSALSRDPSFELWIGAMQRAEVVFFTQPDEEEATRLVLERFETTPLTAAIVDLGAQYYQRWHPSHGIDINDALLAASATTTGGKIFTLNVEHYPMPNVLVDEAWARTQ